MKLNELITHDKLNHGEEKWMLSTKEKDLINFMRDNCSDIIDLYKRIKHYMYHGIRNPDSNILLGKSRVDRRPMDTPIEMQEMFDDKLKRAGFKALRSNSIFCTGSSDFAGNYGDTFVIFPVNGFSYTWSPAVRDFYTVLRPYEGPDSDIYPDLLHLKPLTFVNKYQYKNDNLLPQAITSLNEILISGAYIAINNRSRSLVNILDALNLDIV